MHMQELEYANLSDEGKKLFEHMNMLFHRRKKNIFLLGYHRACVDHGISLSDVPIEDLDSAYRNDIVSKFTEKIDGRLDVWINQIEDIQNDKIEEVER